jgi:hypothetical protein
MRRLLIAVLAALAATLAIASVGTAADVVRFTRIDISAEPLLKEHLTDACGFPVYVQGDGYLNVTLHYNGENRLVRETYSTPGSFVTYLAPTTGRSYRFPSMPREEFIYPGGATLGGPAIYRLMGMIVNHPGEPPEAGLIVLRGTVVDVTPDGVPIVGFTDDDFANAFLRGSLTRAGDPTQSICAALSAA